jgi:hypothetical protein
VEKSPCRNDVSTRFRVRWLPLVACCVAAAGCSSGARLGYDWLPTLALWRAEGYVPLNADQRQIAQRHLEDLQRWHRRTQLDDYVDLLRGVQRQVASGAPVSEADVRRWREEVVARWRPIAARLAPGVAEVAGTLDAEQIARLRAELARGNAKLRRDWTMAADPAGRADARTKRYVERAETFLGPLTDAQKRTVRTLAAQAPANEEHWFAQRLGRQQEFVGLMERIRVERPADAVAGAWMREHLERYAQPREGATRVGTEGSLAAGDAMTVALLAQATPQQRQHLQRKLQEWIDLLQSMRPTQTVRADGAVLAAERRQP